MAELIHQPANEQGADQGKKDTQNEDHRAKTQQGTALPISFDQLFEVPGLGFVHGDVEPGSRRLCRRLVD